MDIENLKPEKLPKELYMEKMGTLAYNYYRKVESQRRCTKDRFMRDALLTKQKNLCAVCGKELNDDAKYVYDDPEQPVMHHIKYKECRNHTEPNCEICAEKYPLKFKECFKDLCMVHRKCHEEIHYEEETYNEK